ncbi:hypothetical protein Tco_1308748, partial [Tanacetum coccineum]
EEDAEQDVDPLIKLAKAAATAAAASAVPTDGSHEAGIPPSSSVPTDKFASSSDVLAGTSSGPSNDPSNKGKSPLMEEDPPVRERTFRQREEDRLVHANQGLFADLLGPDVNEDNFAERIVALIAKRRREFAAQRFQDKLNKPMTYAQQKAYMRTFVKNQSSTIYTTGWTMKHVKSFSDDQLKTEFDKIRTAAADLQSQNIRRSLKRPGADLEQASSKKSKSTETPKSDVPVDSQQPSVEVSSQKATIIGYDGDPQVKHFGRKGVHPSRSTIPIEDGDPKAEHKMCIKYASDDDTPVNLHAVDKKATGTGLVLWGDLKVLIDSPEVNDDISGLVLHMFVDKKYPLSVNLIERMLDHQLEICRDIVGNELTTAVQLIVFLKKQIFDSRRAKVHECPRLDADFLVADSMFMKVAFGVGFKMLFNPLVYVVPTGKDNVIVSTGRTKVIPAGLKIYLGKRTGRYPKGNIMILPPVSVEEHIVVQRETKARTILLQSLHADHMANFHHLDDARDIWLAVKARFGGNDESKKMRFQKILSQLNQMQAKPDNEDCNMKFLRALPPSWSQVADC